MRAPRIPGARSTARAVLAGAMVLVVSTGVAQETPDIIWEVDGHDDEVYSVTFDSRGTTVLSGGGSTARLWDAETGALLHTYGPHPHDVLSAALSPDGSTVAAGWVTPGYPPGGEMRLWNAVSEEPIRDHGGMYVAFSPDGTLVAAAGGGVIRHVRLFSVDSGAEYGSLYCGPGYISSLAFSPDRQHLAVGCTDNTIKVWDLESSTLIDELDGFIEDVRVVAYSPDGTLLAGAEGGYDIDDDAWIRLFHTGDGSPAGAWEAHGQTAFALVFAPNGNVIASSGRDGSSPLRYSIRYWNVDDGQLLREYDELALSLDINADGTRICYGGLYGRVVVAAEDLFVTTPAPTPVRPGMALHAPHPNPFNPRTAVRFELREPQQARLAVYDAAGRRITVLADGFHAAGSHAVDWDGRDARGRAMPSGTYLVRLETGSGAESRKLTLAR